MSLSKILISVTLAFSSLSAFAAEAAPTPLAQCIADSTTGKERKEFMRWLSLAILQHPVMKDVSATIPKEKIDAENKIIGGLVNRIYTKDCAVQLRAAAQIDKTAASRAVFETLGQLSMMELMTDPAVLSALSSFANYLDQKKIAEVLQ